MSINLLNLKAETFIASLLAILVPIFFIPIAGDWFGRPKVILTVVLTAFLIIALLIRAARERHLSLPLSSLFIPIGFFTFAYILSTFFSVSRYESLTPTLMMILLTVAACVIAVVIKNDPLARPTIVNALYIPGLILSLIALMINFPTSLLSRIPLLPQNLAGYIPTGSVITLTIFLLVVFLLAFLSWLAGNKRLTPIVMILFLGLAGNAYQLYLNPPSILPLDISWKIAMSSWADSLGSMAIGAGPGNFGTVFTANKPLSLNATDFWNTRFGGGGSLFFELMATVGLAGVLAWLFLTAKTALSPIAEGNTSLKIVKIAVVILLAASFFAPFDYVSFFVLFLLLGILAGEAPRTKEWMLPSSSSVSNGPIEGSPRFARATKDQVRAKFAEKVSLTNLTIAFWLTGAISILAGGGMIYVFGKAYAADYKAAKSAEALNKGQGGTAYNLLGGAIKLEPESANLRMTMSRLDMAIAQALLQKQDIADSDKQTASNLVQEAITAAKSATALAPKSAAAWENLGNVYSNLIGVANGAENWSISSYQQSLQFDPLNPQVRIALANVYIKLKNYQLASEALRLAVTCKPDYANSHYNLANVYKNMERWTDAYSELQATQTLVCQLPDPKSKTNNQTGPDTDDCKKVGEELASIKDKLPAADQSQVAGASTSQTIDNSEVKTEPVATKSAQPKPTTPKKVETKTATPSSELKNPGEKSDENSDEQPFMTVP